MGLQQWQIIRDRIAQDIAAGELAPGARLPTETELCRLFSAGRHSVRRAVSALAIEGKLRVEQGRGTFVEDAPLIDYHIGRRARIGVLGKLYAEAIENTSKKPVEGVMAAGGSWLQSIRFGSMPQALPVIMSIALYNFESNVRSGTILGIVGAGGIGFLLSDRIRAYRWDEAWSIIILIILMVYVIDWLSAKIRTRIIAGPKAVKP